MAYVYRHYRADTGELFYIGKGTGNRAWRKRGRNKHWENVANKHGVNIEIVQDGLSDTEANDLERQLIAEVGLGKLTNVLEGGEGMTPADVEKRKATDWLSNVAAANRKKAQSPEFRKTLAAAVRKCTIHDEVYTFPSGKTTCRVCFRNRVREWRHRKRQAPYDKTTPEEAPKVL